MPGTPGRSGRKPTPAALKLVRGNPGKRSVRQTVEPPIDDDHAPPEPDWSALLPGDDAERVRRDAAAEWARVVPVLDRMRLLSTLDGLVLIDYCVSWARLLECERALAEQGLVLNVVKTRGDLLQWEEPRRNPHSTTAKEYRAALRGYVAELGLSPSARGRIALPTVPQRSRVDDLLS